MSIKTVYVRNRKQCVFNLNLNLKVQTGIRKMSEQQQINFRQTRPRVPDIKKEKKTTSTATSNYNVV